MTSPAPSPARPSRRFRYSLRLAALVLTAGCVWLGLIAMRARQQQRAVADLARLGATVAYDRRVEDPRNEFLFEHESSQGEPWDPSAPEFPDDLYRAWLKKLLPGIEVSEMSSS